MLIDGDTTPVVGNLDGSIAMKRHEDLVRFSGSSLVDRVIDEFPHEVHQPRRTRASDVHTRAFANRL